MADHSRGVEVGEFGWTPGEFGNSPGQRRRNKEAGQKRAGIFALKSKASAPKLHHPDWPTTAAKQETPEGHSRVSNADQSRSQPRRLGLGHPHRRDPGGQLQFTNREKDQALRLLSQMTQPSPISVTWANDLTGRAWIFFGSFLLHLLTRPTGAASVHALG